MSSLLLILLSAALTTTMALTSAPQWRPFLGIDDVYASARAFAAPSATLIALVGLAVWALAAGVLQPLDLGYLGALLFVAVLLSAVFTMESVLRTRTRLRPQRPGFPLLMTANGAALGVALVAQARVRTFGGALFVCIGAALAFALLLLAFAALHDRLRGADAPAVFREAPLALISAGLMALGFMGLTGLVQE